MVEFLEIPWNVNGVVYPSLCELLCTAIDVLYPSSRQDMSCPVVFGLGDSHGANNMIASCVSPNGARDIPYVDYEAAGSHPLMLDLAKPFYNDVFFDTLYMDILPANTWTFFFRSVATGIVLSQAVNIEGLYSCLRMLGIECQGM
ncbi:hypothetical protein JMJ35_001031 [Cladonia borealis]|uniref:Uncharacterized protein n=1 Tax=Cladonia borealis TaxID=184061 RepID=A0AA39RAH9_9LECA|nr:hypothetical protein JMJ35_001031 [Cladonia borealis]